MSAETEGIGQGRLHIGLTGDIGDIVQIAFRVRSIVINGGRNNAILNCQDANRGFNCAGGADHVPGHRLGGTDRYLVGIFAESALDGFGFGLIVKLGGSAVGIDIINIGRGDACFAQCHFHRPDGTLTRFRRRSNVISVAAGTVADDFR